MANVSIYQYYDNDPQKKTVTLIPKISDKKKYSEVQLTVAMLWDFSLYF